MEPTRQDYITQVEADLKADGGETEAVLRERLKRVKATKSDGDAKAAYFGHLDELRQAEADEAAQAAAEE